MAATLMAAVVLTGCGGKSGISAEDSERIAEEAIEQAREEFNRRDDGEQAEPDDQSKEDAGIPQNQLLTQYVLIATNKEGPFIRMDKAVLKARGFDVTEYAPPPCLDGPDEYFAPYLKAKRKSAAGTTTVEIDYSDVGAKCEISFGGKGELAAFVESLEKSKYRKKGNVYHHPMNSTGRGDVVSNVYITVNGNNVSIRQKRY